MGQQRLVIADALEPFCKIISHKNASLNPNKISSQGRTQKGNLPFAHLKIQYFFHSLALKQNEMWKIRVLKQVMDTNIIIVSHLVYLE